MVLVRVELMRQTKSQDIIRFYRFDSWMYTQIMLSGSVRALIAELAPVEVQMLTDFIPYYESRFRYLIRQYDAYKP
jgi:hypothetical protein